jgi:hypothetical protein
VLNTCPSAQRTTVRSIKSLKSLPQEPRLANCRDDKSHITGSKRRLSRRHSGLTQTLSHASTVRPNSRRPQQNPSPAPPLKRTQTPRHQHRGSAMR